MLPKDLKLSALGGFNPGFHQRPSTMDVYTRPSNKRSCMSNQQPHQQPSTYTPILSNGYMYSSQKSLSSCIPLELKFFQDCAQFTDRQSWINPIVIPDSHSTSFSNVKSCTFTDATAGLPTEYWLYYKNYEVYTHISQAMFTISDFH
jgi:hypothetical protein